MRPLHLTRDEAIVLMLLVGVGATAFDVPGGLADQKRRFLEDKFKITITGDDIAKIINKVSNLTKPSGSEEVVVDGD